MQLAHTLGQSTRHGESLAVRRKGDRFDAFGDANQAGDESTAVCVEPTGERANIVKEYFMEAGDCEPPSVRREVHGCHDRRTCVDRRVVHVVSLPRVLGCVVVCSLFDPFPNERDVRLRQGRFALGHFRLTIGRCDQLQQVTVIRLPRHDGHLFAFATCDQPGEVGHDIGTIRFGRLMAPLAVRLKDRADLLVVADRLFCRIVSVSDAKRNRKQREKQGRKAHHGNHSTLLKMARRT